MIARWPVAAAGRLALLAPALSGCIPGAEVVEGPAPAVLTGRLEGVIEGADECAWLTDAKGRRTSVFYPPGWEVRFNPLRLLDDAGRVVAREGDVLRVRGHVPAGGEGRPCEPRTWFVADTVERTSD